MRTHKIATALYHDDWKAFAGRVIPPYVTDCAHEEAEIKKIFKNAKEVIRQRDALTELRPEKKEEYRQQCEDVIFGLAQDVHEAISVDVL